MFMLTHIYGCQITFSLPERLRLMNAVRKQLLGFSLIAVLCLSSGVSHAGLLNPDFEPGFADWGFITGGSSIAVDNGPSVSGSSAASLTPGTGHEQAISKAIAITPGDLLDLSFDYKTLAGATGNPLLLLRYWDGVGANGFSDGGGGTFKGQHAVTLGVTNGVWATSTTTDLPYFAGSNYVDAALFVNAFGTAFSGTARYDNISIAVPEPATCSLLCLGGLLLLVRHRKS